MPEHKSPVVELNPEVDVQPAGRELPPLLQGTPVVGLNPEVDVQPAGRDMLMEPVQAARDLEPKTPSATKPTLSCQAMTAAFVFGPKLPSATKPPRAD